MAAEPDEIIHQQLRLKIMATLNSLPLRDAIEFPRLKATVEATDGNLGAHLSTLEQAGYISIEKNFEGKKPRTRVAITRTGRRAFMQHIDYLRGIIDGIATGDK
jgi:DNA-binding MarR family transcriptional regulator